jgi:hypothetical protein
MRSQGDKNADDSDVSEPENLDTDEKGLSDMEREYRRTRKLKKNKNVMPICWVGVEVSVKNLR